MYNGDTRRYTLKDAINFCHVPRLVRLLTIDWGGGIEVVQVKTNKVEEYPKNTETKAGIPTKIGNLNMVPYRLVRVQTIVSGVLSIRKKKKR